MSPAPPVHVSPGAAHLSPEVLRLLDTWLPEQRWYPVPAEGVTHQPWLTVTFGGVADVVVALLRLAGPGLATGDESLVIQVPLVLTPTAEPEADTAETEAAGLIGTVTTASGRVTVHDGGVHPVAWHAYFTAALPGACEPEDCAELAGARRISGEQSNTSVVLPALPHATGRGGMLKILRTVALGPHPDVVIPAALTQAGWDGVPRYLGSVELPADGAGAPGAGEPGAAGLAPARAHLAVLSELVHEATDGFELACAYAARDEDFGERALELGAVVAHLHTALREALGPGPALEPAGFMGVLRRRAAEAFADVPALAPHRAGVTALYDSLSARLSAVVDGGGVVALQAIHGDLHLGQALWSPDGWKVLDFEGEPQRPVSERTAPDLPLRDVAGLLRSLDYAAAVGQATDPQWVSHAQISFLEGYREAQSRVGAEERGTRPERSAAGPRPEEGAGYREAQSRVGAEERGTRPERSAAGPRPEEGAGYREAQSRVGAEERGTRPERSAAGPRPEEGAGYREAQSRVGAEERGTRPERSAAGPRPEEGAGYREAQSRVATDEVATSGTVLDVGTAELMLRALTVDKALYEVVYEFRHRPAWMHIPLAAVERVLNS